MRETSNAEELELDEFEGRALRGDSEVYSAWRISSAEVPPFIFFSSSAMPSGIEEAGDIEGGRTSSSCSATGVDFEADEDGVSTLLPRVFFTHPRFFATSSTEPSSLDPDP